MRKNPADREATPTLLRQLAQEKLIDGRQLVDALRLIHAHADRSAWRAFADKLLLGIGTGLIVAGAIFFFAANWDAMGKGARIGLASAIHLIAAVAAAKIGLHRPAGRAAAAGAALLIGPALLTYGQAYQTGADAWELFAGWAVLSVPFAIVVRGSAAWAVLSVLVRIAVLFFAEQHGFGADGLLGVAIAMLFADAASYIAALRLMRRDTADPNNQGARGPTLFLLLGVVSAAPSLFVTIMADASVAAVHSGVFLLAAFIAHAAGLVNAVKNGRTQETAIIGLSACLHIGTTFARVMLHGSRLDGPGLFIFGAFILIEATVLAYALTLSLQRSRARQATSEGVTP